MPSQRHKFTSSELDQYFERISLPQSKRVKDVSTLSPDEQLNYLNLLQKHELCNVPWENLTQHYSWHRVINVKARHLFSKIVHHSGRGGYCMEANYFFHLILHSLGFVAYMVGSRIYHPDEGDYGGWTHVVNIVNIAGERYMLDGGFGPQGPSCAILLAPGVVRDQIAPAQMRVMYEGLGDNLDGSQRAWLYQWRANEALGEEGWKTFYCFVDLEFTPADISSMNFAPWLDPRTFFTYMVVAVRFTTEGEKEGEDGVLTLPGSPDEEAMAGEIDGTITLNHDVLKWRRRGVKVRELRFRTDQERVDALRKYFGIVLADDEREAIEGSAACIGSFSVLGIDT